MWSQVSGSRKSRWITFAGRDGHSLGAQSEGAMEAIKAALAATVLAFAPLSAQDTAAVRFVETDIRAVIQALGRYLPKPVLVGNVQPVRVSLETPGPVDRATLVVLLKGLVESQSLEFKEDSAFFRIAPRQTDVARPPPAGGASKTDSGPVQLFVIRLRHARAADVAATVNLLFGGGGEFSGRAGLSSGTLSDELRRNVVAPQGGTPQQTGAGSAVRPSALTGNVTIVPDELTNSLLMRASQADYDVMKEAVDQLDIRPLQVLIEVLIVETRHDRSLSIGADWFVPPQSVDNGNGTGQA